MKQFNLSLWLQDKSRKVVTRDGREAIIVCTNADDKFPVVAKIQGWDAPFVELFDRNGIHSIDWNECIFDLFFADEEEEFTEFEKELKAMIQDIERGDFTDESFDFWKDRLLDLVRK